MEATQEITIQELQLQVEALKKKVVKLEKNRKDQLSIAVVSGDLDKVLAAMVISLAAAAMDTQVRLFFSFWSLSALRDPKKTPKGKILYLKCLASCYQQAKTNLLYQI